MAQIWYFTFALALTAGLGENAEPQASPAKEEATAIIQPPPPIPPLPSAEAAAEHGKEIEAAKESWAELAELQKPAAGEALRGTLLPDAKKEVPSVADAAKQEGAQKLETSSVPVKPESTAPAAANPKASEIPLAAEKHASTENEKGGELNKAPGETKSGETDEYPPPPPPLPAHEIEVPKQEAEKSEPTEFSPAGYDAPNAVANEETQADFGEQMNEGRYGHGADNGVPFPEDPSDEGATDWKEADMNGELATIRVPSQDEAERSSHSLAMLPMAAALMSFAGVLAYSLVFLLQIFRREQDGKTGQGAKGKPGLRHDDLDFEDLEFAHTDSSPSTAASTPFARKTVQSQDAAEAMAAGWDNNLLSDDGWDCDSWDDVSLDVEGQEHQINSIDSEYLEASIAAGKTSTPPALVKGKAD